MCAISGFITAQEPVHPSLQWETPPDGSGQSHLYLQWPAEAGKAYQIEKLDGQDFLPGGAFMLNPGAIPWTALGVPAYGMGMPLRLRVHSQLAPEAPSAQPPAVVIRPFIRTTAQALSSGGTVFAWVDADGGLNRRTVTDDLPPLIWSPALYPAVTHQVAIQVLPEVLAVTAAADLDAPLTVAGAAEWVEIQSVLPQILAGGGSTADHGNRCRFGCASVGTALIVVPAVAGD